MFNSKECTDLFMVHLNIAYSGLLTLPEASLAGRAAALSVFGAILEYGDQTTGSAVAAELISVVLLYAKCNVLPDSKGRRRTAAAVAEAEDAYVWDVSRVKAAVYCLSVIADKFPRVILENIESTVATVSSVY